MKIILRGWVPPSANQMLRTHFAVAKRAQVKLKWMVADAIATDSGRFETLPPEFIRASGPMGMTVVVFRKRRLDTDNAMAGLKGLVDVVKDLGLIHDDSPKWLDLGLDQRIDAANPRTEIAIEPMAGTPRAKSNRR